MLNAIYFSFHAESLPSKFFSNTFFRTHIEQADRDRERDVSRNPTNIHPGRQDILAQLIIYAHAVRF
jgi:hypothetical protein